MKHMLVFSHTSLKVVYSLYVLDPQNDNRLIQSGQEWTVCIVSLIIFFQLKCIHKKGCAAELESMLMTIQLRCVDLLLSQQ